jgi:acetyl esterase/lipase
MKKLLLIISITLNVLNGFAQSRYLDEVFTDVKITSGVVYGQNYSYLLDPANPFLESLTMDVYEPKDDWISNRPLVIYLHTGSFLPILINKVPTGDMHDSATVEMCKEFARRGYVAISMDYRVGWNPAAIGATGQDIRTGTLIQAVYRCLQDVKTCVRYMKRSVIVDANPYGIDTNKIIIGGQGSGGYVALGYATLKNNSQLAIQSLIASTDQPLYGIFANQPYILEALWGDINGFGGIDTLNHPNWPEYTSNVQFVFNMGGALGDSSWLEAGDLPMVCFHVPNDPFAPYSFGPVIVPTTGDFVVNVSGSYDVIRIADALGNNNCFNLPFNDPYTLRANAVNDGRYGLFPFVEPDPNVFIPSPFHGQAGPWEWWDSTALKTLAPFLLLTSADAIAAYNSGLYTNPNMSKDKALHYIDSIQGYLNPRIVACLNLDTMHINIGIPQVSFSNEIRISPNPASEFFTVQLENSAEQMQYIKLFDLTGRLVMEISNINSSEVKITREDLSEGMYMVKIGLSDHDLNGKLLFQ